MNDQIKSRVFAALKALGVSRVLNPALLPDHIVRPYLEGPGRLGQMAGGYFKNLARYSSDPKERHRQVTYVEGENRVRFLLNVNEYTQCQNYFYIPNGVLKELIVRGGETFVDVGANIGAFSLMAAYHFDRVIAFEPMPETYSRLTRNAELSFAGSSDGLKEKFLALPFAVSDGNREDTMHLNPLNLGGSRLGGFPSEYMADYPQFSNWDSHKVMCRPLDAIVQEQGLEAVSLVKIDVEGFEVDVIKGASATLKRFAPTLYIEVSSEASYAQIMSLLPGGYAAWDPARRCKVDRWVEPDMVFACSYPFA